MPLFTLSTVIYAVYGSISCCLSFRSQDEDDRGHQGGHGHHDWTSSRRGIIATQPQHRPPPLPTRRSYARTESTVNAPTASYNNRNISCSSHILPPHCERSPLVTVTPHSVPFASPSSGDPQHEVPTRPCRRESKRNNAPLSSLLNLPNGVFSEDADIVKGTFTAEDLREKARNMKREELEARQQAKRARKKREYSAEAVYKQEALARKRTVELLNKQAAKAIFNMKNEGRTDGMVDLHGLYVNEALEYAKQEFQSAKNGEVVRFIVGKGLHAKDGKAKIRPALENLCMERGLKYTLDPKNAGVLLVRC